MNPSSTAESLIFTISNRYGSRTLRNPRRIKGNQIIRLIKSAVRRNSRNELFHFLNTFNQGRREGMSSTTKSFLFELTSTWDRRNSRGKDVLHHQRPERSAPRPSLQGSSPATEGSDRVHAGHVHFLILCGISPCTRNTAEV